MMLLIGALDLFTLLIQTHARALRVQWTSAASFGDGPHVCAFPNLSEGSAGPRTLLRPA